MHSFCAFKECILKSSKIKELIENITSLLPKNTEETRDDFKDNLKILLNDYLKKINVVTREEFDIQSAVLTKTKKKLDELEKKLEKK
ncbi:MAG: accessory factor UbiK family protein [Pseudomonadota bacterium]|nr:accessory factor UbiK family protein [Pseudomonadota bacterium]